MAVQINQKRKFVSDGVFYAELNRFLDQELAEDGYAGVEVRQTPMKTEIIIKATRTQSVLGEKGRRMRELTSLVQKRFKFPEGNVELFAEKVNSRGLCALAQAESLRYKLLGGLPVRRACYGVLKVIMEAGAKGCEIIISGKLRAQRAKSMKFKDGYMIKTGEAAKVFIDSAVRHLKMKQGVLGIKVSIMLASDPTGKEGPAKHLPDEVKVIEPKPEEVMVDLEPIAIQPPSSSTTSVPAATGHGSAVAPPRGGGGPRHGGGGPRHHHDAGAGAAAAGSSPRQPGPVSPARHPHPHHQGDSQW